jgi:hypothetical protein
MVPIFAPRRCRKLAARKDELSDVTIRLLAPRPTRLVAHARRIDVRSNSSCTSATARFVTDERRGTYLPNLFHSA